MAATWPSSFHKDPLGAVILSSRPPRCFVPEMLICFYTQLLSEPNLKGSGKPTRTVTHNVLQEGALSHASTQGLELMFTLYFCLQD